MTTRKKRPRDPVQLGKLIVDIATRQTEDREETGRDPHMSELRRLGGLRGGRTRAARLSQEERSAIARNAALKRHRPND